MPINRPPLGLKPRSIWEDERICAIGRAIKGYFNEGKKIPIEWIEEYNELVGRNEQ